jgi:hypothetical protein
MAGIPPFFLPGQTREQREREQSAIRAGNVCDPVAIAVASSLLRKR